MAWNEPGGNGKDPWGHRKGEQGPPDLEDIVKKMQDKLNDLFGGGGGDGGGKQSNRNDDDGGELSWQMIVVGFLVILVVWSLFGFYLVEPAEKGIETRFGRFTRITSQGLNWHIPYPIEKVEKVDVEYVRHTKHKALILTKDENIVEIELVVQYRIENPSDYLFKVRDPDETLNQSIESALREIVGTSKMDAVLTSERTRVAQDTKKLIQETIDRYQTGLRIISVNMQDAQPPEAVQSAFADVIKAREDRETYKNEAYAYVKEVKNRADGQAKKLVEEAKGYKARITQLATGETERFISILTEYHKAPSIMRTRLYLEMMETVLSSTSKIILDTQGGNHLMYLPLDRLLERNDTIQETANKSTLTTQEPPRQAPPPESERGRSLDRNDRGGR